MKRVYERPVMMAEAYETNAYCGACTDNPQFNTDVMNVNAAGPWKNPRTGSSISQSSLESAGYVLGHTFNANERADMISEANGYEGDAQWYWPCDCHDGAYYLEYSAEWTDKYNQDTFVLFQERNNRPGLQINWFITSWPDNSNGNGDRAIASVGFTNPVIADS